MGDVKQTHNNEQTVRYLSHAFSQATRGMSGRNTRGSDLYEYQVEFSYLINEVTRGSQYMVPKIVARVNRLIESINS